MDRNAGNRGDANGQAASRSTTACGDCDAALGFVFSGSEHHLRGIAAVERCAILHGWVHNDMHGARAWNGKV